MFHSIFGYFQYKKWLQKKQKVKESRPPPLFRKFSQILPIFPLIKVVDDFKGSPHLVLVAARDINCGEEITFDYGVINIISWSPIQLDGQQYCQQVSNIVSWSAIFLVGQQYSQLVSNIVSWSALLLVAHQLTEQFARSPIKRFWKQTPGFATAELPLKWCSQGYLEFYLSIQHDFI